MCKHENIITKKNNMKRLQLSFEKTHQFFSIVLNFHLWKWIDDRERGSSYRTNEKYYGIVFSINVFYFEMRLVIAPFKRIVIE